MSDERTFFFLYIPELFCPAAVMISKTWMEGWWMNSWIFGWEASL